jgi:hypothetical protein
VTNPTRSRSKLETEKKKDRSKIVANPTNSQKAEYEREEENETDLFSDFESRTKRSYEVSRSFIIISDSSLR